MGRNWSLFLIIAVAWAFVTCAADNRRAPMREGTDAGMTHGL